MIKFIKRLVFAFMLIVIFSAQAYADSTGGPHLWLSTDPNKFDEGGVGYVGSSATGWQPDSYIANTMPFTMFLYNAAPANKGTASDIGLILVVHKGETEGSVSITYGQDEYGNDLTRTLQYTDFTSDDPYPSGGHSPYNSDGIYAVLRPLSTEDPINLTTDLTGNRNTSSTSTSWTQFVVKSSSFSEIHFDAVSSNGFYNPASHDVNFGGGNSTIPEPATLSLLGLGLAGLLKFRKRKYKF